MSFYFLNYFSLKMTKVYLLGIILIALLCNNLTWCSKKKSRAKECSKQHLTLFHILQLKSSDDKGGCGVLNYPNKKLHYLPEHTRRRKVRIVGGYNVTPPNKYPWMVSILRNGQHHCGGVIISEYYVMTAAHCLVKEECFSNLTKWTNCYVEPGRIQISPICVKPECPVHSVASVQAHKKFRPQTVSYDIALLKVKKKMPCNHLISPICLPISHSFEHSGTIGIIAGWGQAVAGSTNYRKSNVLQEGKMKIQDNKACGKILTKVKTHFCAFNLGQAICKGDSGGPFFVQRRGRSYVVGISSFGSTPDCRSISKEYFTKVRPLTAWIVQKVQKG